MKKIIKAYAAVILCACAIAVTSCSKNPVDKFFDKADNAFMKIDRLSDKENPSENEVKDCMEELKETFQYALELQSNTKLAGKKMTKEQEAKFFAMMEKFQNLYRSPKFKRLAGIAKDYNLSY